MPTSTETNGKPGVVCADLQKSRGEELLPGSVTKAFGSPLATLEEPFERDNARGRMPFQDTSRG